MSGVLVKSVFPPLRAIKMPRSIYGMIGIRNFSDIYRMDSNTYIEEKPTVRREDIADNDTNATLEKINELKGDNWKPLFIEERPKIRKFRGSNTEIPETSEKVLYTDGKLHSKGALPPDKPKKKSAGLYGICSGDNLQNAEEVTMSLCEDPDQLVGEFGCDCYTGEFRCLPGMEMTAELCHYTKQRISIDRMTIHQTMMNNFTEMHIASMEQAYKRPESWSKFSNLPITETITTSKVAKDTKPIKKK